jgi:benzodiazapine receptor
MNATKLLMKQKMQIKNYLSLIIWIMALVSMGGIIGSFTKPEINSWYSALDRSRLTPPNYVFPVAWTILYGIIGACGWLIWRASLFPSLSIIKTLYVVQLILNWSWTPLFFYYRLTGFALVVLGLMDILVSTIICLAYQKIRAVSLLMIPYLLWIMFASYLSFYIWQYN